jgi:pyridinium-3,5-bisthiocarboxylic acid mononucleotide nickel chelatase
MPRDCGRLRAVTSSWRTGTVVFRPKNSMRILHLDCFSGISGDMVVGTLRDLGVGEEVFREAIDALGLEGGIHFHFRRESRQGISGTKFDVHGGHHHGDHHHSHGASDHSHVHGRTWRQIRELIAKSGLPAAVKERATAVFERVAIAEAKIHGVPVEEIGFHEVGAVDSIADIVAACAGFDALGPLRVESSELVEGTGWIDCAHGRFPLPAPATLEILRGIPLRQIDEGVEFITPTGAAIVAEFAARFGVMAPMGIERVGYGIGSRDTPPRPNVLRAILGEAADAPGGSVSVIETNLDDLPPELAGVAMERLLGAGALDVFFTPVQMKKNRPAFLLSVICREEDTTALAELVLRETSSFGVRIHRASRIILERSIVEVATSHGMVAVKTGQLHGGTIHASPEFESCKALAEASGVPVREVFQEALAAASGLIRR